MLWNKLCICVMASLLWCTGVNAQETGDYFLYLSDGRVLGYPQSVVASVTSSAQSTTLTLNSDSVVSWQAGEVDSISRLVPQYPQFTAFKLDDKLNDQLFRDVEATVSATEVIASVSGIGKYLTPTFSLDHPQAMAYVGGVEQTSGLSRLRFADEVVYTLSLPGHERLSMEKISDEVWSEPQVSTVEVPLTVDMLSTNAPSGRDEGLDKAIDDNPSTFFHSTWSNDPQYEKLPADSCPYISVHLPRSIRSLVFYYMSRSDNGARNPHAMKVYASADGVGWTEVAYFDASSGIPTSGAGAEFTSPAITLDRAYSYWRFEQTACGYSSNYLALSEFRLYEVTGGESEPELLEPARYAYRMVPMGREVPVRIDWLTDKAASVPRIDIDIEGGLMVTSKDYYLNAVISFTGNGVWNDYDFQDSVQIKGRGNSSWTYSSKKPYRLKFFESVKPFGMKKGKNWNLIPQAQPGSLLTNPVAQKIARMVGMETANDVIPVELYMNGQYRGCYFFTQKVGMANNSVDFDDESRAVLFELDEYSEVGQFKSSSYRLPVNIKAPEFGEDETLLDYDGVCQEFNRFETAVHNGTHYERFVDMDMLVRYMLVNDLALNTELGHPKSAYLYREDMGHMSRRYVLGPAWDFDWAYGYEEGHRYCVSGEARDLFSYVKDVGAYFYSDILRSSEWVSYRYYRLWEEFMDKHLQELVDYVDDYYAYAQSSFVHNSSMWGDGSGYNTHVANMKSWLANRARYLMNSLTPYAPDALEPYAYGDVDNDGVIGAGDIEFMLSYLYGSEKRGSSFSDADIDVDGIVSLADLTWLCQLLGDTQSAQARSRQRGSRPWDEADEEATDAYDWDIDDFVLLSPSGDTHAATSLRTVAEASSTDAVALSVEQGEDVYTISVLLDNATPYIAYMMDITLPDGFVLPGGVDALALSSRTEATHVIDAMLNDDNVLRVIGYSMSNTAVPGSEGALFSFPLVPSSSAIPSGEYTVEVSDVHVVMENASQGVLGDAQAIFAFTAGKQSQTIPFDALPAKTYGDAPFTLPATTDAGLTITYASSNSSVAKVDAHTVTVVGAGMADITAVQMGNDMVNAATPVMRTLIVAKASLVITADDLTYERLTELPDYTLSYEGFVGSDSEKELDVLPEISCEATAESPVGTYPIRLSGGSDNNYYYTLRPGTLTVVESSGLTSVVGTVVADIYDIHGRLVRRGATSLDGLDKGVYIIGNRKVVVR